MVAPFTGFIVGLYVDLKILIPVESNTPMGSIMSIKKNKKSNDDQSNININISQYSNHQNDNNKIEHNGIDTKITKLDEKILEDEEKFNEHVLNAINNVIHIQNKHSKQIDENVDRLNSIIVSIDHLRESDMIDKQLTLKHMIYHCLNYGFATPEENDKITKLYYAYHELLGGNHEVKSLYEEHYLKLPIHDECMIKDSSGICEKGSNPDISYGIYDKE